MNTLKSIAIGLALVLPILASAQLNFNWAISQGSNDSDLTASCNLDDQGGIYTSLYFRDTADLDPGPGVNMVNVADDEILVLNKHTQQGEYLWSGQFKTTGDAYGYIAEIKNNRILMVIYYTDTLTYTKDAPWTTINPGQHIAVISMNLDGEIISFQELANSLSLYFSDFFTQSDGSILAAGGFGGSVTFETADSTQTLVASGAYDAFICRFSDQMQLEWINLLAGKGDDYIQKIFPGKDGRIYYAMSHDSTFTMQTTHGPVTCIANGEDNAVFGWANSDGSIETAYLFGGDLGDQIQGIVADEDGNMYVNGYFEGDVNFEQPAGSPIIYSSVNSSDGFVSKYAPDGSLVWARIFTSEDYGGVYTLGLNRNTSLYLSGGYTLRSDLDPGPDSIIVDGGYRGDIFACKLDTDGNLKWVYSFIGSDFEGIRNLIPGTDGKLFIHGYYYGDLDCDPGPDENQIVSQGGSDMFLIGLTEEGVVTNAADVQQSSLLIYPNPATEFLVIKAETPIESVDIYSTNGRYILHGIGNESNVLRMDVNDLPPGFYTIRMKSANYYSVSKFVKG